MTTMTWHGSTLSRRNQMILLLFRSGRPLLKTKLVNTSRYSIETMEASTHLSLLHVTCTMRVSTTRPLHHIHLPKMGNLNAYTGPSLIMLETSVQTQNFPTICGVKP